MPDNRRIIEVPDNGGPDNRGSTVMQLNYGQTSRSHMPYQFSKSSPSELAEIWYVGGFRKYLKIKTSYVVWLCGYSPLNIPQFV